MAKAVQKKPTVTLNQVSEAMVAYVRKHRNFPTMTKLRAYLKSEYDLDISPAHLSKLMERARNLSFTVEDTRAHLLNTQVIINLFEMTFHNVKAIELWADLFGWAPIVNKVEKIDNEENILEVRYIDATKSE